MLRTLFFLLLFLASSHALARDNVPDPKLTPGQIATTDKALVCKHGYSQTVRHTTREMKRLVYLKYGLRNTKDNKIDHLVPLALGGADTMKNLWPSNFRDNHYSAADKDRLELRIRELVCRNKLSVKAGQALFLNDWRKAYDRYCPTRKACPSYSEIQDQEITTSFHYRKK